MRDNNLQGGAGNDFILGGGNADVLYGGAGNDHIWGDTSGKTSDASYLNPSYHGEDYLDGEDGWQLSAIDLVAARAYPAGATGRFNAQARASNDINWRATA